MHQPIFNAVHYVHCTTVHAQYMEIYAYVLCAWTVTFQYVHTYSCAHAFDNIQYCKYDEAESKILFVS